MACKHVKTKKEKWSNRTDDKGNLIIIYKVTCLDCEDWWLVEEYAGK